jgi:hypothetical protein
MTQSSELQHYEGTDLSVIVPTFNEKGNIRELVSRLDDVLAGV